jgi:hypothetical protein
LQPKEWLKIGSGDGQSFPPGESGSTSNKASKFFIKDSGSYELGVATQNSIEIFLDGDRLKGRYLLIRPRLAGERVWLIDKPKSQIPRAEVEDLADVIGEQKRKGREFVIWASPGKRPTRYDVGTGKPMTLGKISVAVSKADPSKHIVYGVVLDPYGSKGAQADAHDDWNPPKDIEKTAHGFLMNSRAIGLEHSGKAKADVVESWVEMYPTPEDYRKALIGEPHKVTRRKFGSDVLHSGSWVLGVHLGDEEWKMYIDGELNAFSPGGVGIKTPINTSLMPKVTFVDLVAR